MKVWITKYALTKGIFCVEAEETTAEGMIAYQLSPQHMSDYAHAEGRDWHRTESAALGRARAMWGKKRDSLRKQIRKLDEWEPKIVEVGE